MREIKFRGLEVKGKEKGTGGRFVFGSVIYCEEDIESTIINSISEHQVLTETVGQYTGLKDKNGVDIYEGDIVSYWKMPKKVRNYGPIRFEAPYYKVGESYKTNPESNCYYKLDNGEDLEIIGNIHEGAMGK